MTPPIWLDASGGRRSTLACWTCGREVAPMRFRADDLHRQGWTPPQTLQIPDWCGCPTEYLPVPAGDGRWLLVSIWDPCKRRLRFGAGNPPSRTAHGTIGRGKYEQTITRRLIGGRRSVPMGNRRNSANTPAS